VKLGANEPKKLAALGALVLVGGYLAYTNVFSGSGGSAPAPAPRKAALPDSPEAPVAGAAGTVTREPARPVAGRGLAARGQTGEWHPVLHSKRPEDRIDTSKIDPILHLDILANLQKVAFSGSGRNPFKFGPPPGKPEPLKGPEPKIPLPPVAEVKVAPPPAAPPAAPPPPPIALKYYGFSSPPGAGNKTAFFLDGEDILVAKEGETVKRRYRVVRIGVNSVVMEDTDSKRQQTIPLAEEAG
jgi:hypothetical protein